MRIISAIALGLSTMMLGACGGNAEQEVLGTEIRGRVLDADTFEPIADALVFEYYMARGGHSGGRSGCNYGETVLTDKAGKFVLPVDQTPDIGRPTLEAYKSGFFSVRPPRYARCDAKQTNCEIVVGHWDNDRKMDRHRVEETKYRTYTQALTESRELTDTYLKNAAGWSREQKLYELMRARPICMNPGKTTDGPNPILKAILKDQAELGAPNSELEFTQQLIQFGERLRQNAVDRPR